MQYGNIEQADEITVHVDAELEEIMPEIIENTYQDINTMLEALEQGEFETIRILGHSMNGVGGIGLDGITEIGLSLEQAAKAENSEKIRNLMAQLLNYLERVEIRYESSQ